MDLKQPAVVVRYFTDFPARQRCANKATADPHGAFIFDHQLRPVAQLHAIHLARHSVSRHHVCGLDPSIPTQRPAQLRLLATDYANSGLHQRVRSIYSLLAL